MAYKTKSTKIISKITRIITRTTTTKKKLLKPNKHNLQESTINSSNTLQAPQHYYRSPGRMAKPSLQVLPEGQEDVSYSDLKNNIPEGGCQGRTDSCPGSPEMRFFHE